MKKLLLILLGLLITTNAYAGLIVVETLSEDASINDLNRAFSTIKNEFNGNIEGINIKAGSLSEDVMADSANITVREGDHFNAYTVTGHLPATSTAPDLFSDISAGTSYVKSTAGKLFRSKTGATSHTYTASKDTWVYIDINATFQFEEVATGAAEPTAPSDSLKIAKVVTDGNNITSVSDERVTSIVLGSNEDQILRGMDINLDNTGGVLSVDSGVVYHGATRIAITSFTNMTVATAGDWHDGVVDTGVAGFYYIGVKSTGVIKFLGINPPDTHDTSGNTDEPFYYWDDGSSKWRVIGQFRVDASNNTLTQHQQGSEYLLDIPINITTSASNGAWSTALSCSTAVPSTATKVLFGGYGKRSSEAATGWKIRPNGAAWADSNDAAVAGWENIGAQFSSFTDSSQQIQYWTNETSTTWNLDVHGYTDNLRN